MGFLSGSDGKDSVYKAGDPGLIPGLRRFPGKGHGFYRSHSNILAWRLPWTEEPSRLQSIGSTESDMTEATWLEHTHTHTFTSMRDQGGLEGSDGRSGLEWPEKASG